MHVYSTSGKTVGLGHVVRSLSLCVEARKSGVKIYFYTNALVNNLEKLFVEACDEVVEVSSVASYLECLKSFPTSVDVAFIDDYSVYGSAQTEIRKYCKCLVVVADDFYSDYFNCSIVVNPNPYKVFDRVREDMDSIDCLLEGCEYISLKQSIISAGRDRNNVGDQGQNLLFLSGGTDSASIVESFLENTNFFENEFDKIEIVGSVDVFSGLSDKVSLIPFTDRIHENILNADVVVTPVGSTVWEAFYLNRVVIGFSVSNNQKEVFEYLKENNLILPLNLKNEGWVNQLSECILDLRSNSVDKCSMLERTTNLIDGNGSKRILEKIFEGIQYE